LVCGQQFASHSGVLQTGGLPRRGASPDCMFFRFLRKHVNTGAPVALAVEKLPQPVNRFASHSFPLSRIAPLC